jgi:hypothetical protein
MFSIRHHPGRLLAQRSFLSSGSIADAAMNEYAGLMKRPRKIAHPQ